MGNRLPKQTPEEALRSAVIQGQWAEWRLFLQKAPDDLKQMQEQIGQLFEQLKRERDEARQRAERAEALAKELAEFAIDAAYQGSGQKPLSSPSWHSFISTWEEADDLFRRADFRELLSPEVCVWLESAEEEGNGRG